MPGATLLLKVQHVLNPKTWLLAATGTPPGANVPCLLNQKGMLCCGADGRLLHWETPLKATMYMKQQGLTGDSANLE